MTLPNVMTEPIPMTYAMGEGAAARDTLARVRAAHLSAAARRTYLATLDKTEVLAVLTGDRR